MLDNSFFFCYNRTTIGGRNMEIVTLIISVVVQVTLGIGLVVVYNQYQKATKKVIGVMERLYEENKR